MRKCIYLGILISGSFAAGQAPLPSNAEPSRPQPGIEGLSPENELSGKTSLIRGVLKRLDPIHDQLLVHAFGGSDLHIAFDARTELAHGETRSPLTSIPAGSVISVDTVIDHGKLFARTVRVSDAGAGELSGQVVRYDASKSRLLVRDPGTPDGVAFRVTPSTAVMNHGQPSSPQAISPGALVRVKFAPGQNTATNVEILAERGKAFTFAGRVVSVDLRTRQIALSNESDQTVRELAIGSLDPTSLRLLREGADVNIQAEFDGDRYIARAVTLVPHNP
jgi:hypothetical protein